MSNPEKSDYAEKFKQYLQAAHNSIPRIGPEGLESFPEFRTEEPGLKSFKKEREAWDPNKPLPKRGDIYKFIRGSVQLPEGTYIEDGKAIEICYITGWYYP